jgi:bifunctional enzyme CysN/CysC
MGYLETVEIDEAHQQKLSFRMPVQWVNRPNLDFRGFTGTIASGVIRPGDRVRVLPSGQESHISRIVTLDGDLQQAVAGQSITLTLTTEVDCSRGDVLSTAEDPAGVADQFQVSLIWMNEQPMLGGRPYLMKIGCKTLPVTMAVPKYKINVNSMEHLAAKELALNEIGVCNMSTSQPIAFDLYKDNRETGGFILIDRLTNATVGAGLIDFSLRRSQNIHMQHVDLNKKTRSEQMNQKPIVLWFTGLSGAGKSAIANLLETRLYARGRHTYLLDGDNVRHGMNRDLGFTDADRVENIRRVAEVGRLFVDAGLIVLTAFISPFAAERDMARNLVGAGEFLEIFIDTPLAVAEERDPKGLYKKVRRGELKNFTGIDSPYEAPIAPDIHIRTTELTMEQAVERIIAVLVEREVISKDY